MVSVLVMSTFADRHGRVDGKEGMIEDRVFQKAYVRLKEMYPGEHIFIGKAYTGGDEPLVIRYKLYVGMPADRIIDKSFNDGLAIMNYLDGLFAGADKSYADRVYLKNRQWDKLWGGSEHNN